MQLGVPAGRLVRGVGDRAFYDTQILHPGYTTFLMVDLLHLRAGVATNKRARPRVKSKFVRAMWV